MFDIYAVDSATNLLTNPSFTTDLSGWTDTTGSWSWVADPGVEYDNDGESNPLSQEVTLTAGDYVISIGPGAFVDGVIVTKLTSSENQAEIAEIVTTVSNSNTLLRFEVLDAGDYTLSVYAENLDGIIETVFLGTTDLRFPEQTDTRWSLNYDELIDNPVFYGSIGGWTDATNSWSGSNDLAIYDNDGLANPLSQSVTVPTTGWYRLGIEAATGSTIGQLYARVQGVTPSLIEWHNGQREKFFKLAAGTYTVDFWTSSITAGGVKLVSLMSVEKITGKKRHARSVTDTDYVTIADELLLVDTSGGDVYVNLPTLADAEEMELIVKKTTSDGNSVILDADGSETIDGSTTKSISTQWYAFTIVATADGWRIVGKVT